MTNRTRIFSLIGIATVLGLTGCPRKEDQPPKPKVTADASAATAPAAGAKTASLPVIAPAPAWKLQDVNGATVSSEQFKGKVVVLDFWATWCTPCVKEIPGYIDLARKYEKDGVVIVGVSVDQAGPEVVKAFAAKHKVNYPLVMADEGIVAAFGGIEAIPTTFLIDRQGQIRDRKEGLAETDEYEKRIVSLLN
ncbi:MAG: TlpA disulfide reductase family protein [Opitutaceae bacterium]|nr:TlpA disulfide reductase family protein [Opitutaceae bacterium]